MTKKYLVIIKKEREYNIIKCSELGITIKVQEEISLSFIEQEISNYLVDKIIKDEKIPEGIKDLKIPKALKGELFLLFQLI